MTIWNEYYNKNLDLEFLKLRNFSINVALENITEDVKKPHIYGLQLDRNNIEYFKDNVIPSLGSLNLGKYSIM